MRRCVGLSPRSVLLRSNRKIPYFKESQHLRCNCVWLFFLFIETNARMSVPIAEASKSFSQEETGDQQALLLRPTLDTASPRPLPVEGGAPSPLSSEALRSNPEKEYISNEDGASYGGNVSLQFDFPPSPSTPPAPTPTAPDLSYPVPKCAAGGTAPSRSSGGKSIGTAHLRPLPLVLRQPLATPTPASPVSFPSLSLPTSGAVVLSRTPPVAGRLQTLRNTVTMPTLPFPSQHAPSPPAASPPRLRPTHVFNPVLADLAGSFSARLTSAPREAGRARHAVETSAQPASGATPKFSQPAAPATPAAAAPQPCPSPPPPSPPPPPQPPVASTTAAVSVASLPSPRLPPLPAVAVAGMPAFALTHQLQMLLSQMQQVGSLSRFDAARVRASMELLRTREAAVQAPRRPRQRRRDAPAERMSSPSPTAAKTDDDELTRFADSLETEMAAHAPPPHPSPHSPAAGSRTSPPPRSPSPVGPVLPAALENVLRASIRLSERCRRQVERWQAQTARLSPSTSLRPQTPSSPSQATSLSLQWQPQTDQSFLASFFPTSPLPTQPSPCPPSPPRSASPPAERSRSPPAAASARTTSDGDTDSTAVVALPASLRGTLARHQLVGLSWLRLLHTQGINGILADDSPLSARTSSPRACVRASVEKQRIVCEFVLARGVSASPNRPPLHAM